MDIETVVTASLGNATHLIAADGEAVVIDPPRDAWRIAAVAADRGWRLTHVLETHVHNDYLSGALELRASHGVEIVAPARGGYAFDHRPMDEGDALELAGFRVVARATPGHTPEHLAWDVLDDPADRFPAAVATGGSLLVGSAGRTDLLGAERTDELTAAQFATLRRLAALPPEVRLLPTHGAGSFCSAGPADRERTSTVAEELAENPLLAPMDAAAFRATVLSSYGPYPSYYRSMAPRNRAGPPILGGRPATPRLTVDAFRREIAAGAVVVDARPRIVFAARHIPGALGIELDDSFAAYVGWLLPPGAPLALVLPEPPEAAIAEAVDQLLRIGFDRVAGVLEGGMDAWVAAGGATSSYPAVRSTELADTAATADADDLGTLLDVRDPNELRDDGAVPDAWAIPVGELAGRLDELPRDEPVTVFCKSGSRASIAASILDAAGFEVRLVSRGGARDLGAAPRR
jgi:glyoxylase-like metal-dependent hydrolase (beta-lactamase superfamily II)/rhodanese-related sulfurtransferase